MELSVNNRAEKLQSGNKLFDLLAQLSLADKHGLAIAVNNNVIARPHWINYELNENDKITIIRPTQGG